MSEQKEAASKDGYVHWKTHLISSSRQRHWYHWAELRSEVVRNSSTRELNSSAGESGQRLPSRAVVRNERVPGVWQFQYVAAPAAEVLAWPSHFIKCVMCLWEIFEEGNGRKGSHFMKCVGALSFEKSSTRVRGGGCQT